jgi:hypothetical protein
MSNTIKIKRRLTGGSGAPAVGVEGEIALNFAGGATATPELYAHGGTLGWLRVNPAANITTQSVALGTAADIGTAYTTWAAASLTNKLTGSVVIATFTPTGGVAGAYVLTNSAAPNVAASWTSLGGAVSFATSVDVVAGTSVTGAVNPAVLAGAAVNGATTPATTDAGKYVRVGSNGKINAALLPSDNVTLKGGIDQTVAFPAAPAPVKGDSWFLNKDGAFAAGFTGIAAGTAGKTGDRIIWDGAAWHLIPNGTDLNAYLLLAGGTMAAASKVTFATPTTAGLVVRLDGGDPTKSSIDNFSVDAGTY